MGKLFVNLIQCNCLLKLCQREQMVDCLGRVNNLEGHLIILYVCNQFR